MRRLWNSDCLLLGMNWRQVENQWQQFRSFAKKHWQRLSDEDLNGIAGRRAALVQTLEVRYNMTPAEAARCVDQWLRISEDTDTLEMHPAPGLTPQAS